MAETAPTTKPHIEINCSFCRKSQMAVDKLVAGPGVHICNECVSLAAEAMKAGEGKPITPQTMFPNYWPTDKLLQNLKFYESAVEHIDRSMQDVVDLLRERDVSWGQIGDALGVSRQAAWKRFG